MKQLGEILLEEGLVDEAQLMHALDVQIERGSSLGRVLVELGILSEEDLVRALAQQVGLEYVDLEDFSVGRVQMAKSYRVDVAFRFMVDDGITHAIEIGPGKVLAGLGKRIDKNLAFISVSDMASLHALGAFIGGN